MKILNNVMGVQTIIYITFKKILNYWGNVFSSYKQIMILLKIFGIYDFGSIPTSVYYSEYNEATASYFSGTLYLISAELIGGRWKATYKGTLYGQA